MQNSLHEIIAYILLYSCKVLNRNGLSKYRLTKLVYLCDWCYTVATGKQLTDIQWFFDNYGPFVWDISDTVKHNTKLFKINMVKDYLGNEVTSFDITDLTYEPFVTEDAKTCINFILDNAVKLSRRDFTNLVYATYPIKTSRRYTNLNLVEKAKEYKLVKKNGK